MATTTDLTTLKINYLTQAQYNNALANNQINSDELYFTPADEGVTINLNGQNVQSPSFYAPTSSGTTGDFLKSSGSGAPTWAALTSSEVITALGSQTKNYVLAAPSSANGTPSFRALVADDIPTLSITDKTSGTLTVARGGTGMTTSTNINAVVIGNSTTASNAMQTVRTGNGAFYATAQDAKPQFGTLPVAQGGTGVTSFGKNSVIVGNASATSGILSYVASKAGALYSTDTEAKPTFGTLPVAYGGTGNTSYTANRMIYSESAAKLSASGHYASSDKIAINSTSIPNENLYVNGTSRFSLGSQPNDKTTDKKFIIGSSGSRYLSFGGAGIQAYDASNNASILYLNYYGGNLIVGQNGYNGRVILDTTTAASNSTTPSLRVMQNAQITNADVNHIAQFLASNMAEGGANAIVLGRAVKSNQAGGLLYTQGGDTTASSLSFGFVNNLGLLKITSSGSIYINSGSSSTHNTNTSELLVKGRVVVDPSYHSTNNFSEFRINRSTNGWSAITLGGAQGTTSGAGLGVWLIGNQDSPTDATTAAASITDSQFYISYSKAADAPCRIQGHNATGFSIRPRLAINANVNTDYNLYVNGTSWFTNSITSSAVNSSTFYFGVPSFANSSRAALAYSSTYPNYGIWYFDETNDAMTLDVHGKANSKTEADLAIGALGAGIISTRNRYIPHTNNTTGTVGTQYIPVYVNAGTITQITTNSVLTNLGSTTAASTYAASPRPGVTGTLPIANGGTGATTAAAARANLGALGAESGNYDGMANIAGSTSTYIRTTQNGIIPYQAGGAGSGHSNIGTSTWRFANVYTDKINGLSVPQMQIVSYTGNNTLSMSITFSFAPDIIIALDSPILDNTTGISDVVAGPQICDMSRVTTSWQGVRFGGMSSTQSIGMSYYRSTASDVVICSKSSDGKTYYVKINTTLVNTLPQSIKDTWGAGTTLRIGEKAVYNYSGVVTRFLGIKI